MSKNPSTEAYIHLDDDTPIESHSLLTCGTTIEVLTAGTIGLNLFVNTREQAEKLFDAVSDLTMRWRERDPEHFRADAIIKEETK